MLVIDGHDKWSVKKMLSHAQHYKGSQSEVPSLDHQHLLGPTEPETLGQGLTIYREQALLRDSDVYASEKWTSTFPF